MRFKSIEFYFSGRYLMWLLSSAEICPSLSVWLSVTSFTLQWIASGSKAKRAFLTPVRKKNFQHFNLLSHSLFVPIYFCLYIHPSFRIITPVFAFVFRSALSLSFSFFFISGLSLMFVSLSFFKRHVYHLFSYLTVHFSSILSLLVFLFLIFSFSL